MQSPKGIWKVITASSVGTLIEWYDFYIFGSLSTIIAQKFPPPEIQQQPCFQHFQHLLQVLLFVLLAQYFLAGSAILSAENILFY